VLQPLHDALAHITLAPAVEAALLRREGPLAPILKLVESYEAAAWGEMAALSAAVGVESDQVPDLYLEALAWARERLEDPEF
jgi:c-di-GMP-related signal transduction protein